MAYIKIIRDCLIAYVGFAIFMTIFQGWFIYHPRTFDVYNQDNLNKINAIIVNDNNLEWLFLPSATNTDRILVYFHGNAGAAIDRQWKASFWREGGYHVVLAEYPGYGTNDGSPGEASIYDMARVVMDRTVEDFPDLDLYIYGESIGNGAAVQMATEYGEKALILESGFSSLVDVTFHAMPFLPVNLLLRDRYDNMSKINNIGSRLVMIHGTDDDIVPIGFGQKLYNAYAGDKIMIEIEGAGHNDVYLKTDIARLIKGLN